MKLMIKYHADPRASVTNTDDFLIRILKGSLQLRARPHIENTVNMVPVDHVARIVAASTLSPPREGLPVVHVDGHPRLRFDQYLAVLEQYGYAVPETDYSTWRSRLEKSVSENVGSSEPANALYVLEPSGKVVV